MSIDIPPELTDFVQGVIAAGTFRDESQVVGEALRLLRQREQLRADINAGIDQLEQGMGIPGEEVFERLERKAEALARHAEHPE